jgi:hypothetical protein
MPKLDTRGRSIPKGDLSKCSTVQPSVSVAPRKRIEDKIAGRVQPLADELVIGHQHELQVSAEELEATGAAAA